MTAKISQLTCDRSTDYSLWKFTKIMKRPIMQIPPIREDDGKWAISNEQKAVRFANHLENIFQPNETLADIDIRELTTVEEQEIQLVTPKEVANEIKIRISSKKSPGFDLITGEFFKDSTS